MIEQMKNLQLTLDRAGFSPGAIDGKGGPATARALAALLRSYGINADVTATVSTLTASAPVAAPVAAPVPVVGTMIYQGSARYPVREIAVHCSATLPDWMAGASLAAKVAEIRRWHTLPKPQGRGWRDIGYHWIIDRDGTILPGRPETVIGAGIESHNNGVIHCCLIGGHGSAETDDFSDHFTPDQDKALRAKIADIRGRTAINKISGHNEYAPKACPGFHVPTWYAKKTA